MRPDAPLCPGTNLGAERCVRTYDPTLDDSGQVCRSDAPNSSQPAPKALLPTPTEPVQLPAVGMLLSAVPPPPSALPRSWTPPAPSTAHNNAERTSERTGILPYLSADRVGDAYAVYAGAAMLKGHDPKSGLDVEVLGLSGQVGTQNEFQVGLQRIGRSTSIGSVGIEAVTARANIGFHNDDGSVGINAGAQATALGAETTLGIVDSVTMGLSAGLGVGGSVGLRDLDNDGEDEVCAKLSIGPLTGGVCVETPW